MGARVLGYEGGRTFRRWPVRVAIVVALVAVPVAARVAYLASPLATPVHRRSRSGEALGYGQSLSSVLGLYAMRHDGRLPASLEVLVDEGYMQSVDRLKGQSGPYP